MKTLKFRKSLSELILKEKKNITWRLFDNKNIQKGDVVSFLVWETGEEFAKAKILNVKKNTLGELTDEDCEGHEKFSSDEEMYKTYSEYYNKSINRDTSLKIIKEDN